MSGARDIAGNKLLILDHYWSSIATVRRDLQCRRALENTRTNSSLSHLPALFGHGSRLAFTGRVDCWIGVVQEADRRIVRLAGRLGMAQVPELIRACGEPSTLQLDLTDLVSADMAGVEALQRARDNGAILVGVPGYIQLKLDTPA